MFKLKEDLLIICSKEPDTNFIHGFFPNFRWNIIHNLKMRMFHYYILLHDEIKYEMK